MKHPSRITFHATRITLLAALVLSLAYSSSRAAQAELPALTTASGNPRLPGKFVWADLVTDDLPKAVKFYSQVFDWQFFGIGNYTIAMNDQRPLAGMFQKQRPDPKTKPRWFGYISVSDLGKAQKAVLNSGGRVIAPPQKFPKRGEQAVFADPEGTVFGVIKSGAGDPEDFLAEPGDWIWIQLLSRDAGKAAGFYKGVAGYDVIENTAPNRLNDYVLASKGFARATVRTLVTKRDDVNPTWLPYVRVKNVSETITLAKQLGGKVLVEPRPEVLEGKIAIIADPTDAAIGIMEWRPDLMKGGR